MADNPILPSFDLLGGARLRLRWPTLPIEDVFTFAQPQAGTGLFPCRASIADVIRARLQRPGPQVLLYGLPGVGGTSLGMAGAERAGRDSVRISADQCSSAGDVLLLAGSALGVPGAQPSTDESIGELARLLASAVAAASHDLMVDDVQPDKHQRLCRVLAGAMATLSDRPRTNTRLIVIMSMRGRRRVPECFNSRACTAIEIPPMTRREIRGLVIHGSMLTQLPMTRNLTSRIAELADGYPALAHLLCFLTGEHVRQQSCAGAQVLSRTAATIGVGEFLRDVLPRACRHGHVQSIRNLDDSTDPRTAVIQRWVKVMKRRD